MTARVELEVANHFRREKPIAGGVRRLDFEEVEWYIILSMYTNASFCLHFLNKDFPRDVVLFVNPVYIYPCMY